MSLGELIEALETEDPTRILPLGFNEPHSYRGYYMDLAFEPASGVSIGDMLASARSALGTTYQGYKGGDFTMSEYTDVWLSPYGTASGESIGITLLRLMLAQDPAAEDTPMTGAWQHVATVVAWLDGAAAAQGDQTALRLLKVTEEAGEAAQAYIGVVGQNPRKGVTHSRDDVAKELTDVILSAMVALHSFTDEPEAFFEAYVATRAGRLKGLTA